VVDRYLHRSLTAGRYVTTTEPRRRSVLRSRRVDVIGAMTVAGLMNLALLVIAASVLHVGPAVTSIEAAHASLGQLLGQGTALLFALGLLASGFAASSVGTLAGQVAGRRRWPRPWSPR
jgi:manganese transport protein